GMEFSFIESPLDVGHPNVVRFDMYDEHNRHMTVIGRSLGGGQIMITEVDGNDMSITGDEFTLVVFHEDRPGAISLVSQALSESDINIATMRVFRKGKHKDAVMVITTDTVVNPITVQFMREFPGIQDVMTFEAL
ncbi:MAG: ACT domain-containing protein, partial [Veillonella sp.]|nr:ACT domain-containing protein [Veillonella sp.]